LDQLDWLKTLDFINARDQNRIPPSQPPLDPERLMQEMHVVTPGEKKVYHGYGAFRRLAWRLPLFWPLVPFLYLPGVPELGQRIYLWVARNRYHLVPCYQGVCLVPPPEIGNMGIEGRSRPH